MAISISLNSTFSQLSAEIEGRSYGSGVLKLEPSEAARIKIILPENLVKEHVEATFCEVDRLLKQKKLAAATGLADSFVFGDQTKASRQMTVESLSTALDEARSRRHRTR